MVALSLMGIVSASVYRLLVANQRAYHRQAQRIELNGNLRAVATMLPAELRELSANDSDAGSDIIAMSESAIRYKAMRSLYVMCQSPAAGGARLMLDTTVVGLQALDAERDSVLVFADRRSETADDDVWLHANVVSVAAGAGCPGGTKSIDVIIAPALAATDTVLPGSPVRGFEVREIRKYTDGSGSRWLGARRYHKVSGWSQLQPLAGPLTGRGLVFAYFDSAGAIAANPAAVARIGITVIGRSAEMVRTAAGNVDFLVDSLVTAVALRNNR